MEKGWTSCRKVFNGQPRAARARAVPSTQPSEEDALVQWKKCSLSVCLVWVENYLCFFFRVSLGICFRIPVPLYLQHSLVFTWYLHDFAVLGGEEWGS